MLGLSELGITIAERERQNIINRIALEVANGIANLGWKPPFVQGGTLTNYVVEKSDDSGATWQALATGMLETLTEAVVSGRRYRVSVIVRSEWATVGSLALGPLSLDAAAMVENAAPGTVIGSITGMTPGSTLIVSNSAGGLVDLDGTNLVAGPIAPDYEVTPAIIVKVTETHPEATQSRETTFIIAVTNIVETPPSNRTLPIINGVLQRGEILRGDQDEWDGEEPITYERQWVRDGVDIPDATGATYALVTADVGASRIGFRVTATNDAGTSSVYVEVAGPVADVDTTAPRFLSPATFSITAPTQRVMTLELDELGTVSIVPGQGDGDLFEIVNGVLYFKAVPAGRSYSLQLIATDGSGNASAPFTITGLLTSYIIPDIDLDFEHQSVSGVASLQSQFSNPLVLDAQGLDCTGTNVFIGTNELRAAIADTNVQSIVIEYTRAAPTDPANTAPRLFQSNDTSNRVLFGTDDLVQWRIRGEALSSLPSAGLRDQRTAIAIGYDASGRSMSVGGDAVLKSDAPIAAATGADCLFGNTNSGTRPLNGHIHRIRIFRRRLSDAELVTLASQSNAPPLVVQAPTHLIAPTEQSSELYISDHVAGQSGPPGNALVRWNPANVRANADQTGTEIAFSDVDFGSQPFSGGEIQWASAAKTFGKWSWYATAPRMFAGGVFGLFTYADNGGYGDTAPAGSAWCELDFEFIGADTTKVACNVHMRDSGGTHRFLPNGVQVDLGFDAADGPHLYEAELTLDEQAIFWIDGIEVARVVRADMPNNAWSPIAMKSFVDFWATNASWAGGGFANGAGFAGERFGTLYGWSVPPKLKTSFPDQSWRVGQAIPPVDVRSYFHVTGKGEAYAVASLPNGVTLSDGIISGTPSVEGMSNIVVTKTDIYGVAASGGFTATVAAAVAPPAGGGGGAYTYDTTTGRTPQITTASGGRTAKVPQSYLDSQMSEMMSTMPTLGLDSTPSHTAVQSGAWSSTATWGGSVPGDNATVRIPSGKTVTYDVASDLWIRDIEVQSGGKLKWDITKDTKLVVDTIACMGELELGTAAAAIAESTTLGKARATIVHKARTHPHGTPRFGLMTMGKVRIHGAQKRPFAQVSAYPKAGDTTITFKQDIGSWRVEDDVLVLGTQFPGTSSSDADYAGPTNYWGQYGTNYGFEQPAIENWESRSYHKSQTEQRRIVAINYATKTITLDRALTYAHPGAPKRTLPNGTQTEIVPIVANESRSIRFVNEDTNGHRPHIMFMHDDDVDVRWFQTVDFGRTRSDPTLVTASSVTDNGIYRADKDSAGKWIKGPPIADPDNVRGRYAIHVHRSGPLFGRRQVNMIGLVATTSAGAPPMPGWGIVQHSARAAVEGCIVFNARGAGMVAENGDEIGQWANNVVAACRGDGFTWGVYGHSHEEVENHNGRQGVAYEMQARQILMHGNWASDAHIAFMYHQQNVSMLKRIPDEHSLRLRDPVTMGSGKDLIKYGGIYYDIDDDTYGIEQAQIPDWTNNIAVGCQEGIVVAHRQFTDRGDMTPGIFRAFRTLNTNRPVFVPNYTFVYSFYDFYWSGRNNSAEAGIRIETKSFGVNFINGRLENMYRFQQIKELNYGGFYVDIDFSNITSLSFNGNTNDNYVGHPDHGIMGQSGDPKRIRDHVVFDSADVPFKLPNFPASIDQNAAEPRPGVAKPYFWLDPASDTSVTQEGTKTMLYWGIIVDRLGKRRYSDTHITTTPAGNEKEIRKRENYNATGKRLVERNGCYRDGSTWKCRLWHVDHDRLTGEHFSFFVDLTLTGAWDAGFREANEVDPNATNPMTMHGGFPLLLEAV